MENKPAQITYFAETDARNKRIPFGIKEIDRSRHMYVIGKTGMGKSVLLDNLAIQDVQNGNGLAFIDPHGGSADALLEYVPEDRIKDVLYLAPFDMEYPISFNVMEDVGYDKRHLVASGLMSTFKKIWQDVWSARMEYILSNTLLALLEYPDSTLLSVNKMLSDKKFRKTVVDTLKDEAVKSFWVDEFANYTERMQAESVPAIQNKIGQFTSNPVIRNIIGQPKSTFDFREVMDQRKIVVINLSKGRIGEINAQLLGSMIVTKIYLAAMSRADQGEKELAALPNFNLFVDEFQSFANESFADILSEARKYKLSLVIAHQYIEQMPEEVRAAVFGNVGTLICFRVGAVDAEYLEKEFTPTFLAADIVNLSRFQIYLRLMIDQVGSQPFSAATLPPIERPEKSFVAEIIENSRKVYGRPRAEVEASAMSLVKGEIERKAPMISGDKRGTPPSKTAENIKDPTAPLGSFRNPITVSEQGEKKDVPKQDGLGGGKSSDNTSKQNTSKPSIQNQSKNQEQGRNLNQKQNQIQSPSKKQDQNISQNQNRSQDIELKPAFSDEVRAELLKFAEMQKQKPVASERPRIPEDEKKKLLEETGTRPIEEETFSLESLKKPKGRKVIRDDGKGPTKENREDLKNALAVALGDISFGSEEKKDLSKKEDEKVLNNSQKDTENKNKSDDLNKRSEISKSDQNSVVAKFDTSEKEEVKEQKSIPHEIPEEQLRKILEVDEK